MKQLNEASTSLANISARMDGWLTENDRQMEQFMSAGLAQIPALIADTRNTMRELEKLLVELRDNPSQLVYKPQTEPVVVEP
jgi:ABC-type transporter Mla subunit MlaD